MRHQRERCVQGMPSTWQKRPQGTCPEIYRINQILKSLCCFQYSCKNQEASSRAPSRNKPYCSTSTAQGEKLLRSISGLESTEQGVLCSVPSSPALKRWCISLMLHMLRCQYTDPSAWNVECQQTLCSQGPTPALCTASTPHFQQSHSQEPPMCHFCCEDQ